MKVFLFFISIIILSASTSAQYFPSKNYPVNYFRNPLNIPVNLSGNFGELRTNHFHMGLDMRTNQRENLPVYAAADGYVSQIIVERFGYGRAIIITHPNGYSTLYAHLNDFYNELNEHVKDIQYRNEKWEADFTLPPGLFPVKKGQFIAYSGNTGGSEGPHLHFEIRDTKTGSNINPLRFQFGIADNISPTLYRLFYYDRRVSTYAGSPVSIPVKKVKGEYATNDSVVVIRSPNISFGISAEDKTNKSFSFGIYQAELWVDDSLRNAFRLDDFPYDDSRYMNAAIDFKTKYSGGSYIQHLSVLPANKSSIYYPLQDGSIHIADTSLHKVEIVIKDAAGNASNLAFKIRLDTTLLNQPVYHGHTMIPNLPILLQQPIIAVSFSNKAFYDTLQFDLSAADLDTGAVSQQFSLHNFRVPVHDSFTVKMKLTKPVDEKLKDKIVMQLTSNRKIVAEKGTWDNNWMEAKFWDLGKIQLLVDTIPPTIQPIGFRNGSNLSKSKTITFIAEDDAGELKDFRAEVDGKWIMFSRKKDYFIHQLDGRISAGLHELKVLVMDEAGNTTERIYSFKR